MRFLAVSAYKTRAGADNLPRLPGTTDVDDARILAAIEDACGEIRAMLPEDLLDNEGNELDVPVRLQGVLPGIAFDLARYQLTDGATGSGDAVSQRYNAARKLLRTLKKDPERQELDAEILEGPGTWIPGEAT